MVSLKMIGRATSKPTAVFPFLLFFSHKIQTINNSDFYVPQSACVYLGSTVKIQYNPILVIQKGLV